MIIFDPQDESHEGLLVKWWADLGDERDLTFHSSLHRLGAFLHHFRQDAHLIFDADQKYGLWMAIWTQPFGDGVLFSTWVHPAKRNFRDLKAVWSNLQIAYNVVFDRYPRVVGYTRQASLHAEHLKLGYEFCGRIPDIVDGKSVYIYSMSREQWANRKETAAKIRAAKREKRVSRNGAVVNG